MKDILNTRVRIYAVLTVLLALVGIVAGTIAALRSFYHYEISLPSVTSSSGLTYGSWPALDNVDFYTQTLASLKGQGATFINVNLSTMELEYYVNGSLHDTFKVLAKGRPGSWWETPTGLYKVEAKIPKDYSSFAHVYSPWALDFQGNFLIHGWPYYPDGTPVGSTYSGGCIRLSTEDAKKLYDEVGVNTPVLVSSANFQTDTFRESPAVPAVNADAYVAADLKSNFVLIGKNPNEEMPLGSLTKLMTALVAVEYVNIEKKITVTEDMIVPTATPRLKVGQDYMLYDLLQPLLKESNNEAAVAISKYVGPSYFVSLMNKTAQSIGMKETHFVDTSGVSTANVSTAHDVYLLAQYLYNNRIFILRMTKGDTDSSVYGPSAFPDLQNVNIFYNQPGFVGGTVGLNSETNQTVLSIFEGDFTGGAPATASSTASTTRRPYAIVILGSTESPSDAKSLFSWIHSTYH